MILGKKRRRIDAAAASLRPLFSSRIGETVPPMARAKYDAALAIARACLGDNAIEIREMAGYT